VDEYQDTNALQADILAAMRRRCPNITVVGDDAQAIYSFRAATVENILGFADRFPGATVVSLDRNYRSTPPILSVAGAVMAAAGRGYPKNLSAARTGARRPLLVTCLDDAQQADLVCRRVLELREEGTSLISQAVLFRAAHHSDVLEVELARRNIPFAKYGGLRFVEAAHVKDVLAFLRILENPFDEVSWFRILQLLVGVGPEYARRIMGELGVGGSAVDEGPTPLSRLIDGPPTVPPATAEELDRLRGALADSVVDGVHVGSQIERFRRFYEPVLIRRYDASRARKRDLEQLARIAEASPTRARFLADLTLDPPESTADLAGPPHLDEDYLILSTIHSAKGCEWDAVHVIHATDGNLPSDMATRSEEKVEEERRLFYVALSRARDSLFVYVPLRYYHRKGKLRDAHSYAQLTRFVSPRVRELFDEWQTEGEPEWDTAASTPVQVPTVDAFLDQLWAPVKDAPPTA